MGLTLFLFCALLRLIAEGGKSAASWSASVLGLRHQTPPVSLFSQSTAERMHQV